MESKQVTVLVSHLGRVLALALVELHGRQKLALSEQAVDLLDELKGGVLLIEDKGVHSVDGDGHLTAREELL